MPQAGARATNGLNERQEKCSVADESHDDGVQDCGFAPPTQHIGKAIERRAAITKQNVKASLGSVDGFHCLGT